MTVAHRYRAALERKVKGMYSDVAANPHGEFHFEMGRQMAERLGYAPADLDRIPSDAIDSFAGVGLFLSPREPAPERTGCRSRQRIGNGQFHRCPEGRGDGRVVGVDMTDAQLAKASRLAQTRCADDHLPQGLHRGHRPRRQVIRLRHLERGDQLAADKARVFQEAFRLLRRGGRLAIADIVTELPLPENVVCNADLWAACIGGAAQRQDYRTAIETAGLHVERVEENTE